MDELKALRSLARAMGVHTRYVDGLKRPVAVAPETLVRVCAALGAPVDSPRDAAEALRAREPTGETGLIPPVLVAWDGALPAVAIECTGPVNAGLLLEDGEAAPIEVRETDPSQTGTELRTTRPLPYGYHNLTVEASGRSDTCTVISAPLQAWRRPGSHRSWGVGTQLAALRSQRSRSMADLKDLESLCRWVGEQGGDLVTVLPLLPTFNSEPEEPSPYSAVSRLFWSELILDLGDASIPSAPPATLDVTRADAEVRAALAGLPAPDPSNPDDELVRYAQFRGAQTRLGRNWRDWPSGAGAGLLEPVHIDPDEERFHLVAQAMVRRQLHDLRHRLDADGFRLGLDLAVGGHPDGYDPWSRQELFGDGMSVGAPPDEGFPTGQDWGFSPVLPGASRQEGHQYLAACIGLQASLAGVLRVDHIMAWTRLYWIPHGFGLHEGTYVSYPAEELFAILTLESERHRCEVVGENLGTVPPEIDKALPRHRIWEMYLAQFEASSPSATPVVTVAGPTAAGPATRRTRPPTAADIVPPAATDAALIGTHDTPTFAGWLSGADIDDRVRCDLVTEKAVPLVREERSLATQRLAERLDCNVEEPRSYLEELLEWLGRSDSPLVVPWLEDLWLENKGVNLPGTRSSEQPNWQRPMRRLLDDIFTDPEIEELVRRLDRARKPSERIH